MDVYEIRYRNFRRLIDRKGADGKTLGITGTAELLGKAQAQVSHFGGENPIKNIGHKIARQIEDAFGLPRGALDKEQEDFSVSESPSAASHLLRPDPETLHAALTLLRTDENPIVGGGPYRPLAQAERLADLYEWVAKDGGRLSDESNARFLEQVEARRREKRGQSHVRPESGERPTADQQRGAAATQ